MSLALFCHNFLIHKSANLREINSLLLLLLLVQLVYRPTQCLKLILIESCFSLDRRQRHDLQPQVGGENDQPHRHPLQVQHAEPARRYAPWRLPHKPWSNHGTQ